MTERAAFGSASKTVLDLLNEHGPMNRMDLCEQMGKSPNCVSGLLSRLVATDRAHVLRYERTEHDGRVLYPRAVYAAGPGENAKRLRRLTDAAINKRSKALERTRIASVFDLGLTRQQRKEKRASIRA